jgi:hypothetical protein
MENSGLCTCELMGVGGDNQVKWTLEWKE